MLGSGVCDRALRFAYESAPPSKKPSELIFRLVRSDHTGGHQNADEQEKASDDHWSLARRRLPGGCVRPSEYVALGNGPRPELLPERYESQPCNDREDRNKYPHVFSSYVIDVDRVVEECLELHL